MALILLLALLLQGPAIAAAQSIQTINNTLYFRIPGASLALTADNVHLAFHMTPHTQDARGSGSSTSSSLASQADVVASQQTIVSTIQPQVCTLYR